MIEEGLEQQQIIDQLAENNQKQDQIIEVPLPKQKQIINQVKKANSTFQEIFKKQRQILMPKKVMNNELKNMIVPLKSISYNGLISVENLTASDYRQFSLIKQISQIVFRHIAKYIQMQTQVDLWKKQLLSLPSGKSIIEFVNEILKEKDVKNMFNLIYLENLKSPKLAQIARNEMIRPLLKKTISVLEKFAFEVNQNEIQKAIFNQFLPPFIESTDQVSKLQTQALKFAEKKNQQIFTQKFDISFRRYLLKMVSRKKLSFTEHERFFCVVDNIPDYEEMIIQALNKQQKELIKP